MSDTYDPNAYVQLRETRLGETDIGVHRPAWRPIIELAMWHRGEGGDHGLYVAQPLVMMRAEDDGRHIEPFARLGSQQAQRLMDELWRAGVRPAEASGSVGQLGAVQAHLADMRKLVFEREASR